MVVSGMGFDGPLQEDFVWMDGDSFQIGDEMLACDGVCHAAHHLGKTFPNNILVQVFFMDMGKRKPRSMSA